MSAGTGSDAARVYLIGAGPGDESLITVKGLRLLERADVVVYDYLVAPALLDRAQAGAELVFAGKKGFSEHVTQEEINALLVAKARELGPGGIVARLKGGDPFVFGRGGEEALFLAEHGVPFEVVPGVTSGIAAPAYAGIPVTHRKLASSVTFVTGHEDPTRDASGIDWAALAALAGRGGTVCFYMGMRSLPLIAKRLGGEGLAWETPVALVRWGTCPRQETLVSDLAHVAQAAEQAEFGAPAIIVVGRVVALRERVGWYEGLPLFGKRVIVTRARSQADALSVRLKELGASVEEFPTIELAPPDDCAPLDSAIDALGTYDWLVFASANGVERFFQRLRGVHGLDARALGHVRVAVIGPATARRLRAQGIEPDAMPESYRAEALADALKAAMARCGLSLAGCRVLLPRAQVAREALPELLCVEGAEVDTVASYKTVVPAAARTDALADRLEAGEVDAVTFTSSSTARNLCAMLGERAPDLLAGTALFSIGPITSETMRGLGLEPTAQAGSFTIPGLVDAMCDYYSQR